MRLPVQRTARAIGVAVLALAGAVPPARPEVPPMALTEGAAVDRDLFAPWDMVVVDAAATIARLEAAGEVPPVVVRSEAGAAEVAVAQFEAAFARTRSAFLAALERDYGARRLGSRETDDARFETFRAQFEAANTLLPVSPALAQTWARGRDGADIGERLSGALRGVMRRQLIGALRPASVVFVVTLAEGERVRAWGDVAARARRFEPSEVMSLETAGEVLRRGLEPSERVAGAFLTGLLRPNVVEDAFLTGLLLRERLGDGAAARAWRRGEPIVRAGAPIDRWSELALQQLRRMGYEPLVGAAERAPSAAVPETGVEAAPAGTSALWSTPEARWMVFSLVGGVALGVAMLGGILWIAGARARRASPAWVEPAGASGGGAGPLREALLPHLARELKDRLVHVLFAQRGALLDNEAAASQRVEELEARLAKLQPAIAERIRGYEQRIQALERELEEKDQETRDLIRAKLVLARRELDAEIVRNRLEWN